MKDPETIKNNLRGYIEGSEHQCNTIEEAWKYIEYLEQQVVKRDKRLTYTILVILAILIFLITPFNTILEIVNHFLISFNDK